MTVPLISKKWANDSRNPRKGLRERVTSGRGRPVGGGLVAPPLERFRAKTQQLPNGCVQWTGCVNSDGYGQFVPGGKVSPVLAHRWIWEHERGAIHDGMTIDHLCVNEGCVNTAHMELVTASENARREAVRRRESGLHARSGALTWRQDLVVAQAEKREMKLQQRAEKVTRAVALHREGLSAPEIAARLSVTAGCVSRWLKKAGAR